MKRITWLHVLLVVLMLNRVGIGNVKHSFTEPYRSIEIAATEPGVIVTANVREGTPVVPGMIIAELNSQVLQQELKLAQHQAASQAEISAAAARLKIKKTHKENIEPLLDTGHANPAEVDQARLEFEESQASFTLAEERAIANTLLVQKIEAQLSQRRIVSPIQGVVTRIYRQPGEHVSMANPQFARVVQLDRLKARFYLAGEDVLRLQVGTKVDLRVSDQVVQALVEFVSPVTDSDSGTARVDVVIDNQTGEFRSGEPCVWLQGDQRGIEQAR